MARSRCCQCGAVLEREASPAASAAAVARRAQRGSGSVAGAAGGSGAACDDWRCAREELARVRCSQTVSNSKATLKYRHGLRTILVGTFYYDY